MKYNSGLGEVSNHCRAKRGVPVGKALDEGLFVTEKPAPVPLNEIIITRRDGFNAVD